MPAVIEGLQKMDDALRLKMTNIMHAAYYVAKQEVPFTHFSSLNGLINRTGGSLPGCYSLTKPVLGMQQHLLPTFPILLGLTFIY